MKKLEADILKTIDLIEFSNKKVNQFDRIYPFTNENINDCFKFFDLKDKNCLTVLSSSDQTFDIFLKGAKSVTAFDSNPLVEYYFNLKKAALLADLSLEEYLVFFCFKNIAIEHSSNLKTFNEETYIKLLNYLDNKNYEYWNKLYKRYQTHQIRKPHGLFNSDELLSTILKKQISYLNENNFKLLKAQANEIKINFINTDINDLPNKLTENYDFMYLSNIIQYVDDMYENKYITSTQNQIEKLKIYKKLIKKLSNNLNNNGEIIAGYIYDIDIDWPQIAIFNSEARNKVFHEQNFEYKMFKDAGNVKDACLVYTKNRK